MTERADGNAFVHQTEQLRDHYGPLLARYGHDPRASAWSSTETQDARLRILMEVGDLRTAKVLDYGCGMGRLFGLLRAEHAFDGDYVGYDIVPSVVEAARSQQPGRRFEVREIFNDGIPERFDYVLVSGVFNVEVADHWSWMTSTLQRLFAVTDRALAFNGLSTYVNRFDHATAYFAPERVFTFCKENLSPAVTLRHDYEIGAGGFEYTMYIRRTAAKPRPSLERAQDS